MHLWQRCRACASKFLACVVTLHVVRGAPGRQMSHRRAGAARGSPARHRSGEGRDGQHLASISAQPFGVTRRLFFPEKPKPARSAVLCGSTPSSACGRSHSRSASHSRLHGERVHLALGVEYFFVLGSARTVSPRYTLLKAPWRTATRVKLPHVPRERVISRSRRNPRPRRLYPRPYFIKTSSVF